MGALIVVAALAVGYVGLAAFLGRFIKGDPVNDQNAYVRAVHDAAGNKWYPHELADGEVRWYLVRHDDAVDM